MMAGDDLGISWLNKVAMSAVRLYFDPVTRFLRVLRRTRRREMNRSYYRTSHPWLRRDLMAFVEEQLDRVEELNPILGVEVILPTGFQSIAQRGTQHACAANEFNCKAREEIDHRLPVYSHNTGTSTVVCRTQLLPQILESIGNREQRGHTVCLGDIVHLWFNLFDRNGNSVGTLYFGPFVEARGSICSMHDLQAAKTLPRVKEVEVEKLGQELAVLFTPVMTHIVSPGSQPSWLLPWMLGLFLPTTFKKEVWAPAFADLLEGWLDRLYYPQKWIRGVYHTAFCFRTMLLFVGCFVPILGSAFARFVGRFVPDFLRKD